MALLLRFAVGTLLSDQGFQNLFSAIVHLQIHHCLKLSHLVFIFSTLFKPLRNYNDIAHKTTKVINMQNEIYQFCTTFDCDDLFQLLSLIIYEQQKSSFELRFHLKTFCSSLNLLKDSFWGFKKGPYSQIIIL